MIQAGEGERKDVARALHENTSQCLAAVEMNLVEVQEAVKALSPESQGVLEDALVLLQSCIGDIQTVCYTLYPSILDHLGLKAAIENYAKDFARRNGIEVTADISGEVGRMPAECEVSLYRAMQEALMNLRRQAGNQAIVVRMSRAADEVLLEVSGSGAGTGLERGTGDIGLRAMRERLRTLGGRLGVVSGAGVTTVRAALPFDSQASGANPV